MKKVIGAIVVLLAFLLVAGSWYFYEVADKAKRQTVNQPIVVNAARVEKVTIPGQIQAVGTLIANQSVNISSEMAGRVAEILFKEGGYATKGKPLIKLDDTILKAELESSEADLALSKINYQRALKLVKEKFISQQDFDRTKFDFLQKQAQVKVDKTKLEKMTLAAPFNGVVGSRKISVGDYVNIGQGILSIVDKDNLRLTYQIPEKYLEKIKIGQTVDINVTALPNEKFIGKIFFISPQVDETSHSVELQARVENKNHKLSPGMFVKVSQIIGMNKNALVVPEQSLLPTVEGQTIYKIVNNKAVSADVKVGAQFNGKAQILSGLKAGDLIITAGQDKIKDGSKVEVTKE